MSPLTTLKPRSLSRQYCCQCLCPPYLSSGAEVTNGDSLQQLSPQSLQSRILTERWTIKTGRSMRALIALELERADALEAWSHSTSSCTSAVPTLTIGGCAGPHLGDGECDPDGDREGDGSGRCRPLHSPLLNILTRPLPVSHSSSFSGRVLSPLPRIAHPPRSCRDEPRSTMQQQ